MNASARGKFRSKEKKPFEFVGLRERKSVGSGLQSNILASFLDQARVLRLRGVWCIAGFGTCSEDEMEIPDWQA